MPDPWAAFNPQSATAPTPIIPRTPAPQTPAQQQQDVIGVHNAQLTGEKTQLENDKLRREAQAKSKDFDEARGDLVNVIDNAMTAIHMSGDPNTTALRGSVLKHVPGTKAYDLSGHLDTIGANVAFSRLQKMRQESPTGGALGNVSDNDMRLLKSVVTSLDQSRSNAEFQKSMRRIVQVYSKMLAKMPGGKDALVQWRDKWLSENRPPQQSHDGWSIEEAH